MEETSEIILGTRWKELHLKALFAEIIIIIFKARDWRVCMCVYEYMSVGRGGFMEVSYKCLVCGQHYGTVGIEACITSVIKT